MTTEQKKIYDAIDEILWRDWDPIELNDSGPRDEYQDYTPEIFHLKIGDADVESIARKLDNLVTDSIGLQSNMTESRKVAEKIFAL
jgi:hypothetical protein